MDFTDEFDLCSLQNRRTAPTPVLTKHALEEGLSPLPRQKYGLPSSFGNPTASLTHFLSAQLQGSVDPSRQMHVLPDGEVWVL